MKSLLFVIVKEDLLYPTSERSELANILFYLHFRPSVRTESSQGKGR